ncbi:hypothetical protein P8935_07770 [Telmatobacter sp. DSM 110680]|uniref:Uncharacterized protein n=1 Tax=Telmatobacter sp. DSM 110680 TaxID=3036704 RepID=A0AAU7DPL1_9BACT
MRFSEVRFVSVVLLVTGIVPCAGAQSSIGKVTLSKTTMARVSTIGSGSHTTYNTVSLLAEMPDADLVTARRNSAVHADAVATEAAAVLSVPVPQPNSVMTGATSVAFKGLTTVDTANTNGFVVSPPDQGLCAGHGFAMEVINLSMAVYSTSGARLTVPESVYSFFGFDPNSNSLSDPRCYYDASTQRWFVSMTDPFDSATGRSYLLLAVSQTSDPRGAFYIYVIDSTDDGLNGTPANPGCNSSDPCFGDQPTLGADAYGVYLTTNEFGLAAPVFNGAEIYAISKSALEAGTASSLVHIGDLSLAEGYSYSVQPASSPDLSGESGSGVEYFLSALDFYGTLDNRIAVWALTNTSSLSSATPNVSLSNDVIRSEVYGQPGPATQKSGPYPLGQALGDPEELISSGDDRMQNVVFASGHLWGALNTVISDGTNTNVGIAYFDVKPSVSGGLVSGKVQGQSYISIKGNSVIYPGTGVTEDGTAAIAFTVTGPSFYPSAAYAKVNPSHASSVSIVAEGVAPQDDFSGYPQFGGGGVARWGDYSWGVADGNSLWLATEYIPGGISALNYYTDFGTYVYEVKFQ